MINEKYVCHLYDLLDQFILHIPLRTLLRLNINMFTI